MRALEWPIRAVNSLSVAPLCAYQVLPEIGRYPASLSAFFHTRVEVAAARVAALRTDEQPAVRPGLREGRQVMLDVRAERSAIEALRSKAA